MPVSSCAAHELVVLSCVALQISCNVSEKASNVVSTLEIEQVWHDLHFAKNNATEAHWYASFSHLASCFAGHDKPVAQIRRISVFFDTR